MNRRREGSFFFSLFLGIIIVILSIYGFFLLRLRPALPEAIDAKRAHLVQVNDQAIEHQREIEYVLIQKNVGDWATFRLEENGKIETVRAQFISFYSRVPFPLLYFFIGIFCYSIGFIVFILKREDPKARILYWLALAFSFLLIVSGGTYCLREEWLSYLPGVLFFFFYPLAPAILLHFSLAFSSKRRRRREILIYTTAFAFSSAFVSMVLLSTLRKSIETFRIYLSVFHVFRVYLIALLLLAILHLVFIYKKTLLDENRAQIKWVFLGLFLGLGPFIFAYQIPRVLGINPLLTEDVSAVFFIIVPLGFALSIFKFKLIDVELVINRSLVYSLLTIFTVSVYLFTVQFFQGLFSRLFVSRESVISLGGAVLAAAAFHPARRKIQNFVDKAFFRQSYDYRKAIRSFSEKAQGMMNHEELVDLFSDKVQSTIPVTRLVLLVRSGKNGEKMGLLTRDSEGKDDLREFLDFPRDKTWARRGATLTEENIDFSATQLLAEKRIDLVFPFPFNSTSLTGFMALGRKKSGERFSRDDIDLLLTLAGELTLNLERIKLCEEIFYERASKEKLDELNRLKTEFVSTFSHELRTPMSSIQGLTEILIKGKIKDKAKQKELLAVIASESGRLSQLIHNILDFGKIEQHVETFSFQKTEVTPLVEEVMRIFYHELETQGFVIRLNVPEEPIFLSIDRDSVKQVLINLIDNAIKYSSVNKEVEVSVLDRPKEVEIRVQDKGIGICPEDQEKIFDKFYRASEGAQFNPKGVGLGLKIVKHVMTAHQGEIRVKSQLGRGSMFRLIFPKDAKQA
jgi:signal transduction histidine kinase